MHLASSDRWQCHGLVPLDGEQSAAGDQDVQLRAWPGLVTDLHAVVGALWVAQHIALLLQLGPLGTRLVWQVSYLVHRVHQGLVVASHGKGECTEHLFDRCSSFIRVRAKRTQSPLTGKVCTPLPLAGCGWPAGVAEGIGRVPHW